MGIAEPSSRVGKGFCVASCQAVVYVAARHVVIVAPNRFEQAGDEFRPASGTGVTRVCRCEPDLNRTYTEPGIQYEIGSRSAASALQPSVHSDSSAMLIW
jgi:hypothetical protein